MKRFVTCKSWAYRERLPIILLCSPASFRFFTVSPPIANTAILYILQRIDDNNKFTPPWQQNRQRISASPSPKSSLHYPTVSQSCYHYPRLCSLIYSRYQSHKASINPPRHRPTTHRRPGTQSRLHLCLIPIRLRYQTNAQVPQRN